MLTIPRIFASASPPSHRKEADHVRVLTYYRTEVIATTMRHARNRGERVDLWSAKPTRPVAANAIQQAHMSLRVLNSRPLDGKY